MVQGRGINSSINETGQKQAALFHAAYSTVPFDKVYVSALKRTKESVQRFIDAGIPFEAIQDLDEISWGHHEGQTFDPEMHDKYLKCVESWQSGNLDASVSGGESPNQVMARQQKAIEYILSNSEEEHVLICSHGRAIRILVCWLLDNPLHKMELYKHQNLCLYQFDVIGGKFSLEKENDVEHLASLQK